MLIAMPIHRGRISPLFDLARRALLVEIVDHREVGLMEVPFVPPRGLRRADMLQRAGVDHVVCAAISTCELEDLLRCGLAVWPCVVGHCLDVAEALTVDGKLEDRFRMPGLGIAPGGVTSSCANSAGRLTWGWRKPADTGRRRLARQLAPVDPN